MFVQALDCVQGQQEVLMKLSGVEQQVQAAQRALQSKTEECERDAQALRRWVLVAMEI